MVLVENFGEPSIGLNGKSLVEFEHANRLSHALPPWDTSHVARNRISRLIMHTQLNSWMDDDNYAHKWHNFHAIGIISISCPSPVIDIVEQWPPAPLSHGLSYCVSYWVNFFNIHDMFPNLNQLGLAEMREKIVT